MVSRHSVAAIALLTGGIVLCSAGYGHAQSKVYVTTEGVTSSSPRHLRPMQVRNRIDQTTYALGICYRKGLKKRKNLRGVVVARLVISANGDVLRAKATGIKYDVAGCVARTLATIQFPKPGKVVQVTYTARFDTSRSQQLGVLSHQSGGVLGVLHRSNTFARSNARILAVTSTSGLARAIVRRYLHRKRYHFSRCYKQRLKLNSKRKGTLRGRFIITTSGRVALPTITGRLVAVARCVRRVLRTMKFPKPKHRTTARFRLSFKPTKVGKMRGGFGVGSAFGVGSSGIGVGSSGTGSSGGGTRWGTTGGYGAISRGSSTGGYGSLKRSSMSIGKIKSTGALDAAIILRYLRRSNRRFSYCYELGLVRKPTLAGKVQLSFVIQPTGKVTSVKSTGLTAAVAKCVASKLRRIQFPKPRHGGSVTVSVPTHFKPRKKAATSNKAAGKKAASKKTP